MSNHVSIATWRGKDVDKMTREELLDLIHQLGSALASSNTPDEIDARALGRVEMLKRPSMTMLEKIARAIFYAHYASGPMAIDGGGRTVRLASVVDLPDVKWEAERERWIECAASAVEAMREPIFGAATVVTYRRAEEYWTAMIDAILTEPDA